MLLGRLSLATAGGSRAIMSRSHKGSAHIIVRDIKISDINSTV